jgi:glycosyltransferase involved in cell wall biosynthesis
VTAISVVMATHNGAKHLSDQLRSIAAQTVTPAELVVHDDASTDSTVTVIEEFAKSSPFPVRLTINDRQRGFSETFLAALEDSNGDIVALCDQDDVWLTEKLERCSAVLAEPDVVLAMHAYTVVDEHLVPTGRRPRLRSAVLPRLAADPWLSVRGMAMVFRSDLLRLAEPETRPRSHYLPGTRVHHDEWIYGLARAIGRVAFIAEALALYRQHGANVTGAPEGLRTRVRDVLNIGHRYYAARRDQAREWADVLTAAASQKEGEERDRLLEAARHYGALSARAGARAEIYDPHAKRRERTARVARLAREGGYGRRGFGVAGLARDAVMIALGRHG